MAASTASSTARAGSFLNRLFRSIKLLEIGAGTTEVRKMIIAGELLKDMATHG